MAGQDRGGEPVVVRLPAQIDLANADEVRELLCSSGGPGVAVVVADLTLTSFWDSAAFGEIMAARRMLAAAGVQLMLAVAPGQVPRIMHLLGLDHVVVPCPPAALQGDNGETEALVNRHVPGSTQAGS
jgi:anti-anti-sigma factor